MSEQDKFEEIREGVRKLCSGFGSAYWQRCDRERAYPEEFVSALTQSGYLAALVPEQYGGVGLSIEAAGVILEEIHRSGGNAGACHAQMYTMGTILRHGSDEQKTRYLPGIADGSIRLQAFGVSEPESGTDTSSLRTTATLKDGTYTINGQKIWTSRAEHTDLMLLLCRTTPINQVKKKSEGLSVFLVDMRTVLEDCLQIRPIRTMMNHATTQVFFDNMPVPGDAMIGDEGKGFQYILSGMNAERILIAAECIGDAKWFIDKSVSYANNRSVFGRPIGQNQGIQFPVSRAYAQMRAAELMLKEASRSYDAGENPGEEANLAKLLAADTWRFRVCRGI